MLFSLIIPVYNRPSDLKVVLEGLAAQTYRHFELIVVESNSEQKSDQVVDQFRDQMDITYLDIKNRGQGFSRNAGMEVAKGDYLVILDSDIIIPDHYLQSVYDYLQDDFADVFGGPDMAHDSFTDFQKAADFALTSYLTTGGTRGRKKSAGTYYPRSFNMGLSRAAYKKTGGYRLPNCGEDIEFSIRLEKAGFRMVLIPDAYVYHKRKASLAKFVDQMVFFGKSRINLHRIYPDSFRPIHLLPVAFIFYVLLMLVALLALPPVGLVLFWLLFWYFAAIFIEALFRYRSPGIAFLSLITTCSVFFGYGYGLIRYHFQQKGPYTPIAFPD
jgi:glycosyltransferase involved in cell wall biosynthesis